MITLTVRVRIPHIALNRGRGKPNSNNMKLYTNEELHSLVFYVINSKDVDATPGMIIQGWSTEQYTKTWKDWPCKVDLGDLGIAKGKIVKAHAINTVISYDVDIDLGTRVQRMYNIPEHTVDLTVTEI